MPYIFPIFVLLLAIFAYFRNKATKADKAKQTAFFNREAMANAAPKKDLSFLPYITIDANLLDMKPSDSNEIISLKKDLLNLSNKKIVNLTGISNTDLKLTYGVANLATLTEYDENFTHLCTILIGIAEIYHHEGDIDSARLYLEYSVRIRSDITLVYTLLASIYREANETEKLSALRQSAEELNSLSRDVILNKLNS